MPATWRPTVGALFASASGVAAALPSVVAEDDILVCVAETEDVSVTPPAGWSPLPNTPISQPNAPASRTHLWWKRAGASESNLSFPDSGDHQIGRIGAIVGCPRTGDPYDVSAAATDNVTDTSGECPGLTTTGINRLIVNVVNTGYDHTSNVSSWYSTWANTSVQSATAEGVVTERVDNAHTVGSGGTVGVATGFKPAAGTVDPTTVTLFAASTKALYSIAFKSDEAATWDTLTSGQSSGNTSPYTTLVIAAQADSLLIAYVAVSGTAVATPTLTGMGLTWTLIDQLTYAGTGEKLAAYRAQVGGSAVSGAVTITVGSTPSGCNWSIHRVIGHNQTTPIAQVVKISGFAANVAGTFAAAADAANRQIVGVSVSPQNTGNSITPPAGFVEDSEVVRSTPNVKLWVAHRPNDFTTSPITVADDSSYDYGFLGLEISFASSGHSAEIDQVAETTTAQPLGKAKAKAIGQPAESSTAQPLARSKARAVGQAATTESAQPLGRGKSRTLGQVLESSTAQHLVRARSVGQVLEQSAALALTRGRSRDLGQVAELETAQALAGDKARALGQVVDTATAAALTAGKASELGRVTSEETAQALDRGKAQPIGHVLEEDQAQPLGTGASSAIAGVVETATAQPLGRVKAKTIGQVVETSTARQFVSTYAAPIGSVSEVDAAQPLGRAKSRELGQVVETSSCRPLTQTKARTIGQVLEVDTAAALAAIVVPVLGGVTESDTAQPLGRGKAKMLGHVVEHDVAHPLAADGRDLDPIPGPPQVASTPGLPQTELAPGAPHVRTVPRPPRLVDPTPPLAYGEAFYGAGPYGEPT